MSASWDLYGVEPDLWLVGPEGTDEERFIAKINLPADASPALRARRFAEVRVMKAAPALQAALAPIAAFLDGLERGAFAPGDCRKVLRLLEPARAALRAAKGEQS